MTFERPKRKKEKGKAQGGFKRPVSIASMEAGRESGFAKALHALQTPLYMTAGFIDEYIKRTEGKHPTPYYEILKESGANLIPWISDERRRVTYGHFIDNPHTALAMDIIGDPITWWPAAGAGKVVKGLGIAGRVAIKTPIKAGVRGMDKLLGTGALKKLEEISDATKRIVKPNYDIERLGGKELLRLKGKQYRDAGEKLRKLRDEIEEKVKQHVPDYEGQAKIYDLIERRPVMSKGVRIRRAHGETLAGDVGFTQWQNEMKALTESERLAYKGAASIQEMLEKIKIESGLLSAERAENFRKTFGIQYLPHMKGEWSYFMGQSGDFLDALKRGEKLSLEKAKTMKIERTGKLVGDTPGGVDDLIKRMESSIDEIRGMPRIDPNVIETIKKEAGFLYRRKRTGTAAQLGDVRMDLAAVLGLESAQVATAFAAKTHAEALLKISKNKGWIFDEMPIHADLVKQFGKKQADKLMRGGFQDISSLGIKNLKGEKVTGFVPKPVAKELFPVFGKYTDPKEMTQFLRKYKQVQDIWKAWTLSIFPAYHTRNAVSNLWNNFLAGMGPTAMPHYNTAHHLMWKWKRGVLSVDEKKIIDEALRMRVIDEGWFKGELGHLFEGQAKPAQLITKMYHPGHNPAVKFGFSVGRHIEDHARLSHYLWAKNARKMAPADAAASVNKFLFDYRYGLTPTEQKIGRDFLFPFIAWTRFNIPLQLEMMVTRPGRFLTMPKTIRAIEDYRGEHKRNSGSAPPVTDYFMADWMKRATKLRLRYNEDKEAYEYFILDQWLPSADVGKLFDKTAFRDMVTGLMSPFTKLPIEILFNYNLFQKRKIREYKGQKKKLLGVPMAPEIEHAARAIRLINESDRIIEGFFREDGDMSGWAAFLRGITGKAYPYQPEKQKKRWEWDINKRISRLKYMQKREEKRGYRRTGNRERLL
jgi:hypothetical protein